MPGFLLANDSVDPDKTASTVRDFAALRWSVPGDFATVETDGGLKQLGRCSQVFDTHTEKVFPKKVSEALKCFPGFGRAAMEFNGDFAPDLETLSAHVREHLFGHKAPRELQGRSGASTEAT